ncbi:WXG100 family type VII secretion target [Falsarthrobacter nasiphocae]|uniref:ESAT-6-like protein n=1 Tax=Falsarthrobacter nasiphocae TaxID=189863 RepID=A0AAE4C4W3_9MICC|nr:WXG100 family type VII secretion target [Falsarthrobacter nasiphocae]MDR6891741.1 WXG100 family type VII secretion target [Falsarthrobacter nasiphocae]
MAIFNVDSEQLAQQSAQVQGTIARLQTEINQMQAGLQGLQASWGGQASNRFQGLVVEWRATQMRVEESLLHINEALSSASRTYAEVESQNTAMFG